MTIEERLSSEFGLRQDYSKNIIELIDEGNTIPFIARYRKEVTGNLSDEVLRDLNDRLNYLRNLEKRKEEVIKIIDEQGKLTDELFVAIGTAKTLAEVEDLYRPYKQKKRTRAIIAKEKGLEPLAQIIIEQKETKPLQEIAKDIHYKNELFLDSNGNLKLLYKSSRGHQTNVVKFGIDRITKKLVPLNGYNLFAYPGQSYSHADKFLRTANELFDFE